MALRRRNTAASAGARVGTFDRHPALQVIVGHWGEVILFYLERIALLSRFNLNLERPVLDYFRQNVSYTPSGIFSQRYLRWAVEMAGIERMMFSTDYPFQYAREGGARRFLEESNLSEADRRLMASGNWERIHTSRKGS